MILMSIFVLILICKIQIMKRILILFSILAVLVSCERPDLQDEVSYAVMSGKKVVSSELYVSSPSSPDGYQLAISYEYEYDEKGNVVTVNGGGEVYDYFYQDGVLVGISTDRNYWTLTYNEDNQLSEYVKYGSYFPFFLSFDYEENRMTTVFEYGETKDEPWSHTRYILWDGENVKGMDDTTFAYNNIIDNFNVPVTMGIHLNGTDPLFKMFVRSKNLVSAVYKKRGDRTIRYDYSYIRNDEGDICRIDVADGFEYYLIKYE